MTVKYIPIPPNGGDPQQYAFAELQDLSRALSEAQEFAFVQELNVAPDRPRDGMVVLADGTNWNPGSGAGFYGYDGGWKPLSSGLAFPATQVSSSDANTLDDYEEGTWTPSLRFGGATTGITYSTQSGTYTKVGRFVFLTCRLTLTSKGSATGQADIAGVPFSSISFGAMLAPYYANMVSGPWAAYISGAQIVLTVLTAGGIGVPDNTSFNNNSDIIFTGHFQAS